MNEKKEQEALKQMQNWKKVKADNKLTRQNGNQKQAIKMKSVCF